MAEHKPALDVVCSQSLFGPLASFHSKRHVTVANIISTLRSMLRSAAHAP